MRKSVRAVLYLVQRLGLCLAWGCSSTPPAEGRPYDTVADDARRDSVRAKEENARAVELIREGEYAAALEHLRAALSADIMYGPAHNNLGKAYYHQKRLYLAAWEFQYAVKLMPNRPEPRNNLGMVFEAVGKYANAAQEYGKALALSPDNPEILGNLARLRVRRGERDQELRSLLEELVMKDTRPDWIEWARERLELMGETDD